MCAGRETPIVCVNAAYIGRMCVSITLRGGFFFVTFSPHSETVDVTRGVSALRKERGNGGAGRGVPKVASGLHPPL